MKKQTTALPVETRGSCHGGLILCPVCKGVNCFVGKAIFNPNEPTPKYDQVVLPVHGECGHSFEIVFESGKGTAIVYSRYETILCDCGKEVLVAGYEAGKTEYDKETS